MNLLLCMILIVSKCLICIVLWYMVSLEFINIHGIPC